MAQVVGAYARVSTDRQAEAQTIEQQLDRLQAYALQQGWTLPAEHIYRDDGHSGARLDRPALDRLRDAVARGQVDLVLVTSPDRLARRYAYQVWLLEEFERAGCPLIFLERPPTGDPQDALVIQIRGAVAEYERTVIADRMRRGRLAALRAGRMLPWTVPPYGYRFDPRAPRDPAGLRIEESEAAVIRQIYTWYGEDGLTLYAIALRLTTSGVPTPRHTGIWNASSIRKVLLNATYTGTAYGNQLQMVPAQRRNPQVGRTPKGAGGSRAACGRARNGSASPSRPLCPPRWRWPPASASPRTGSGRGATAVRSICCAAWSAAPAVAWRARCATTGAMPTMSVGGRTPW